MPDENQMSVLKSLTPRQISEHSKVFFAKYYLGISLPTHQVRWTTYFDRKRHLQLSPRDHGKTTIFNLLFPIWLVLYVPNVRILIVGKTSGQANKILGAIRKELTENPRIIEDFGHVLVNKGKGGALWAHRTKVLKDPTVEAVGALGAITGGHFDFILPDDIIDDENTKTASRMEDMSNWFNGTIMQLVEPDTRVLVTGTRKGYAELYQELIDNPLWQKQIDRAIIQYPESYEYVYSTNSDGQEYISDVATVGSYEVLWPEEWDIKTLLLDRQAIGSIIFDREKQNDPSGMKGQFLNVDWLQYYRWEDLPEDLTYYMSVDLAISEKETADETVACLMGYDSKNRKVYLIEFKFGRWNFPTAYKNLVGFFEEWSKAGMRPVKVLIENNVYQAAMAQHIASNTWLPAVGVRTVKDKVSKMTALAPHFENGSVLLRKSEMLGMPELRQQWAQFPYGKHDDILDSLAIGLTEIVHNVGVNLIGLVDPESSLTEISQNHDDYEYVFCSCGTEYGWKNGIFPDKNGFCDTCGKNMKIFPSYVSQRILGEN